MGQLLSTAADLGVLRVHTHRSDRNWYDLTAYDPAQMQQLAQLLLADAQSDEHDTTNTMRKRCNAIPKLADLETIELWQENDSAARWRVSFPFTPAFPASTGIAAETLSVVYFTLEPGKRLGVHTDSVEEALLVVDGTVEVTVSTDPDEVAAGQMALVPAMAPHGVQNVGDERAQVVGFFPRPDVTSTFDEPVMPLDQRVFGPPLADDELDGSTE